MRALLVDIPESVGYTLPSRYYVSFLTSEVSTPGEYNASETYEIEGRYGAAEVISWHDLHRPDDCVYSQILLLPVHSVEWGSNLGETAVLIHQWAINPQWLAQSNPEFIY